MGWQDSCTTRAQAPLDFVPCDRGQATIMALKMEDCEVMNDQNRINDF